MAPETKMAIVFCWVARALYYWVAALLVSCVAKLMLPIPVGAFKLSFLLLMLKLFLDFRIGIKVRQGDLHE